MDFGCFSLHFLDAEFAMNKIQIYEPALCGSRGVCDDDVDHTLVVFSSNIDWAKQNGAQIERFNLTQHPQTFTENPVVKSFLELSGAKALPLILLNGEVTSAGHYPNRTELANWAGITRSKPAKSCASCNGCSSGKRCF